MLPVLDMSNIMVRFLILQVVCLGLSLTAGSFEGEVCRDVCSVSFLSFLQLSLEETQLIHFCKSSTSDTPTDCELLHCSTIFQAVRAMETRWGLRCRESLSQTS